VTDFLFCIIIFEVVKHWIVQFIVIPAWIGFAGGRNVFFAKCNCVSWYAEKVFFTGTQLFDLANLVWPFGSGPFGSGPFGSGPFRSDCEILQKSYMFTF